MRCRRVRAGRNLIPITAAGVPVTTGCTATDAVHGGLLSVVIAVGLMQFFYVHRPDSRPWRWLAKMSVFVGVVCVAPVLATTHKALGLRQQSVLDWMTKTLTIGHWIVLAFILLCVVVYGWRRARRFDEERRGMYDGIRRAHQRSHGPRAAAAWTRKVTSESRSEGQAPDSDSEG